MDINDTQEFGAFAHKIRKELNASSVVILVHGSPDGNGIAVAHHKPDAELIGNALIKTGKMLLEGMKDGYYDVHIPEKSDVKEPPDVETGGEDMTVDQIGAVANYFAALSVHKTTSWGEAVEALCLSLAALRASGEYFEREREDGDVKRPGGFIDETFHKMMDMEVMAMPADENHAPGIHVMKKPTLLN